MFKFLNFIEYFDDVLKNINLMLLQALGYDTMHQGFLKNISVGHLKIKLCFDDYFLS